MLSEQSLKSVSETLLSTYTIENLLILVIYYSTDEFCHEDDIYIKMMFFTFSISTCSFTTLYRYYSRLLMACRKMPDDSYNKKAKFCHLLLNILSLSYIHLQVYLIYRQVKCRTFQWWVLILYILNFTYLLIGVTSLYLMMKNMIRLLKSVCKNGLNYQSTSAKRGQYNLKLKELIESDLNSRSLLRQKLSALTQLRTPSSSAGYYDLEISMYIKLFTNEITEVRKEQEPLIEHGQKPASQDTELVKICFICSLEIKDKYLQTPCCLKPSHRSCIAKKLIFNNLCCNMNIVSFFSKR